MNFMIVSPEAADLGMRTLLQVNARTTALDCPLSTHSGHEPNVCFRPKADIRMLGAKQMA
jgi:hypothetical protein